MPEHELWVTALFNKFLAAPANWALNAVGITPANAEAPWSNAYSMLVLVVLIMVVALGYARTTFSVDKPSRIQTILELFHGFIKGMSSDLIDSHPHKHVPYFGALFAFILIGNLIGILPTFESPTMFVVVPLGLATVSFGYYNFMAIREVGIISWFKHLLGPIPALAPLMLIIEVLSHLSRLLSLTVRLYANMFAGEMVFLVFLGMVPLGIPVLFMGLHTFVAFLQAYIFTLLVMVYLGQLVEHGEH
jgi:F-type H+-transporting ATPase subunit a